MRRRGCIVGPSVGGRGRGVVRVRGGGHRSYGVGRDGHGVVGVGPSVGVRRGVGQVRELDRGQISISFIGE